MSLSLITAFISATGLVMGSVIGGISSWFITKYTTEKSLKEQVRLQHLNMEFKESNRMRNVRISANQIRLDICTAIFQSIRAVQNKDNLTNLYIFPIDKNYHSAVAALYEFYTIKELSYIYQLYGILEKVNNDILSCGSLNNSDMVKEGYYDIVKKVYGEFSEDIISKDIEYITYYDLCSDKLMKEGYRKVLLKLNTICKNNISYLN